MLSAYKNTAYVLLGGALCKAWQLIFSCFSLCALVKRCFRSRLEARWAVFFDLIGLKYEYEVEGFEMNGIRYLPDFYIPSLDRWFEIKAKPLSEYEMKKCEEFCFNKDNENIKFSVLIGSPEAVKIDDFAGVMEYVWEWPSDTYPENYRMLAPNELSEKEYYSRFMRGLWVVPDVTEEELAIAATAAREARFEFGESPQINTMINSGK